MHPARHPMAYAPVPVLAAVPQFSDLPQCKCCGVRPIFCGKPNGFCSRKCRMASTKKAEEDALLLTLHVGEADARGVAEVLLTNIGGEELACVRANVDKKMCMLWSGVVSELGYMSKNVYTMLPNGCVLRDGEASLRDALKC